MAHCISSQCSYDTIDSCTILHLFHTLQLPQSDISRPCHIDSCSFRNKHVCLLQSCLCSMLLWRYQVLWSVKWQVIRPPVDVHLMTGRKKNDWETRCKLTCMQMRDCEILEGLISSYTLNSKALIGKILFTGNKKHNSTPQIYHHAAESCCRGHDGVDLCCLSVHLTPMNAFRTFSVKDEAPWKPDWTTLI